MKLGKLLFAAIAATVLLGALVASASARNFEFSSTTKRAIWTRLDFSGGFGTIECEVVIELRFHTRSFTKTPSSLIGYVTAANVTRCARGGATVNRGSLPWHDRYRGFTGRLPLITGISKIVEGAEWRLRDPFTGITCTISAEMSSTIITYTLSAGAVARADASGFSRCGAIEGEFSGGTSSITDGSGAARITVRLI